MAKVWWKEHVAEENGWLWRLEIQKAGAIIAPGDEEFVEMGDYGAFEFGEIVTGFEKILFGLQQTGSWEVQVDARRLEIVKTDDGYAVDTDLRDAVLRPIAEEVGELDRGSGDTRAISGGTVWTLYCDMGAGYDSGSDDLRNAVVLRAMQRPLPRRRHKIVRTGKINARHMLKITLVDIVRAAMEAVLPDDLARLVLNTQGAYMKGPFRVSIDTIFYDDSIGLTFGRFERQFGSPWIWSRYYPVILLYTAMQGLIDAALKILLRDENATFEFYAPASGVGGAVFDHWTFAKQNYRPDGQPNWDLPNANVYYRGTSHYHNDSGDTSVPVGGILIDQNVDDQQSLFKFDTIYDFLAISCEAMGVAGLVHHHQSGSAERRDVRVFFARIADFSSGATITKLPEEIEIEEPGNIVARAVNAITGLEGDDRAEYKSAVYWGNAIEDEQDENIRALWHNLPRIGDQGNLGRTYNLGGSDKFVDIAEIKAPYVGVVSEDTIPWKLYYIEVPQVEVGGDVIDLTTGPLPIRVHASCQMKYGNGMGDVASSGFGGPYPSLTGVPNNNSARRAIEDWWRLMVAQYADTQSNAGIPAVVAETVAHVFGNNAQVLYPDVPLKLSEDVRPRTVGTRVTLGSSGTASIFREPGSDALDHLSTECHLLHMKITVPTPNVVVQLLHIEKP